MKSLCIPLSALVTTLSLLVYGCASGAVPEVSMRYTAKKVAKPSPKTQAPISVSRFLDLRAEKTSLVEPESEKKATAGLLAKSDEDYGVWVSNALIEELTSRGYSAQPLAMPGITAEGYEINGAVHQVAYERGGRSYRFRVLVDIVAKKNGVVLMNKQYWDSPAGKPTVEGASASFETALRGALDSAISDLERAFAQFEGAKTASAGTRVDGNRT